MPEQLIKSIELENRQRLDIFDASKGIAGDRWQVTVIARMVISIDDIFSDDNFANNKIPSPPADEIKAVLGDTVTFEVKKQRNFIDDKKKSAVFDQLLETFIKFSAPYLSHPAFALKFVLKQYHAKKRAY